MNLIYGEIRVIKWQVVPSLPGLQWTVGQEVGYKRKLRIVQFLAVQNSDGEICSYNIVCVKLSFDTNNRESLSDPFVWKSYNKLPDEVEYFEPDGTHDYLLV